ncbi:hypothetical protein CHLRE_03g183400v5 [Chlamydomonas reinhardtii]|uniref:Uncharacterized protein n=1 Tax=Chlamydomonas reinhardtii TaxID=3055 RepID=A8JH83_CHLRE|nr:uncharacterized protein CHLRE_03g183400v5 [Chlamydomonas reinhardtii]PNW85374.1 hypothetical protein CHLRE_03g183400v5 [Chlamydomonas reinhardtii]|eukprot:XP_001702929.1 predicted protein [Chlamydomonas reinhardtii]
MKLSTSLQRCERPALTRRKVANSSRRACVVVKAEQKGDFFSGIKAVAKKVQGSLPIVGLVSRLAAPEGGFDELAYPEFCRAMIDKCPVSYRIAQAEMEKKYGKPANSRWILLVLWMTKMGVGLVPAKDIISASRRLRVTQDIEIEMDRFEQAKAGVLKKYSMVSRPEGKLEDQLGVAVDALCTLCIGLKDGEAVPEPAVPLLRDIVGGAFPEAPAAAVEAAVSGRASRAVTYS